MATAESFGRKEIMMSCIVMGAFMGVWSDPNVLFLVIAVVVGGVGVFVYQVSHGMKEQNEAEQEAWEKHETARMDYEAALDDLEAEDCKQNRINALKKGRKYCAISREYAHGNAAVTAVDEQMITNDINARTCD